MGVNQPLGLWQISWLPFGIYNMQHGGVADKFVETIAFLRTISWLICTSFNNINMNMFW